MKQESRSREHLGLFQMKHCEIEKRVYDSTCLTDFLLCHKRFYWRFVKGYQPKIESSALVFGSAIHEGLKEWYNGNGKEGAISSYQKGVASLKEDTKRTRARGEEILQRYFKQYQREPFKVKEVEVGFEVVMPGGSVLRGRMDMIVEWDNMTYVVDHKTTSQMGSFFFQQFDRHFQIDSYIYACRELKGKCNGAIINGILVAKTKIDFARDIKTRTEEQINEHAINYLQVVADLERCVLTRTFYGNKTACGHFGSCPYIDLCQLGEMRGVVEKFRRDDE